jgi:hypothetical protein
METSDAVDVPKLVAIPRPGDKMGAVSSPAADMPPGGPQTTAQKNPTPKEHLHPEESSPVEKIQIQPEGLPVEKVYLDKELSKAGRLSIKERFDIVDFAQTVLLRGGIAITVLVLYCIFAKQAIMLYWASSLGWSKLSEIALVSFLVATVAQPVLLAIIVSHLFPGSKVKVAFGAHHEKREKKGEES